jgi:hypothetical protein
MKTSISKKMLGLTYKLQDIKTILFQGGVSVLQSPGPFLGRIPLPKWQSTSTLLVSDAEEYWRRDQNCLVNNADKLYDISYISRIYVQTQKNNISPPLTRLLETDRILENYIKPANILVAGRVVGKIIGILKPISTIARPGRDLWLKPLAARYRNVLLTH